jgi:peroxiredoxin Q/BCP
MLKVGDLAPDFELEDDAGNRVRLRDLLATGPLVLYFYPADSTPVCTREACMFRDAYEDLAARGVRVVGVSPQRAGTHARFRERHRMPFPLLVDAGRAGARAYGALGFLGLFTRRVSYLIGREGKVEDVARGDFRLGEHEAFVRRVLERLGAP